MRSAARQGTGPDSARWGVALLIGRGMAAWTGAWAQAEPASEDRADEPRRSLPSEGTAVGAFQGQPAARLDLVPANPVVVPTELIAALSGMVLGALRREVM